MKLKRKAILYLTLIGLCFSLFFNYPIFAANEATSSADLSTTITPTPPQNNDDQVNQLNNKIHDLEQKVNDLKKAGKFPLLPN